MKRAVFVAGSVLLGVLLTTTSVSAAVSGGFIENRGQLDQAVLYYAPGGRVTVYFTGDGLVFDLKEEIPVQRGRDLARSGVPGRIAEPGEPASRRGCAVYLRFAGASPAASVETRGELATSCNYFLGSDPAGWRAGVPAFAEIVYRDLWPGVDLVWRDDSGNLTYEIVAAPGADAGAAAFEYEGARRVLEREDGSLSVETSIGNLLELRPRSGAGRGGLLLAEDERRTLAAPADNRDALLWSTFLGGSGDSHVAYEGGHAVSIDASGNVVVTGMTPSPDFPTTPGAYDESYNGLYDVFVSKLSSCGSKLLWSTFLGGSHADYCLAGAMALDASGNVFVAGSTFSVDFPTTPGAYNEAHNGNADVFVSKLSSCGSQLLWSTLLGGSDGDWGYALILDASGNAFVGGGTFSSNFPTTPGAYDESYNGGGYYDAFVSKLSCDGSELLWSTFLGGSQDDICYALALDASGNVVATGYASYSDFPTTPGAYDESFNGASDVFVSMLTSDGSELRWSTFLGGSGHDGGVDLALDAAGNVVVTGDTQSPEFPTTPGAFDESFDGVYDVFVSKLSACGSDLLWSTFLGGSQYDYCSSLALDASGNVVVTGHTRSSDFPTTSGAYNESHNGGYTDAFVSRLSFCGSELLYSTFLGGSSLDEGIALALDASGNAVVTGWTRSSDFPTTPGAYDETINGCFYDAFVAKLDIESTPIDVAIASFSGLVRGLSVHLSWTLADRADFDRCHIQRAESGEEFRRLTAESLPPTTRSYSDGDVLPGRSYRYRLELLTSDGRAILSHEEHVAVPAARLVLEQNHPNPFNPATTITFYVPIEAPVRLTIYDTAGRRVRMLVGGEVMVGRGEVVWNGRGDDGRLLSSGIYYCRLEAGKDVQTRKLVLLK